MKRVVSSRAAIASLLLATSLAICGCGGKPTQPKPATTPASPREALIQLTEATHEGNVARLFAAVEATEAQKEFLRVMMQFLVAATDFRDAFIKAYGQQAWEDFQDDSKAPKDGNAQFTISDPKENIGKIRNLTIDERGDQAFCQNIDASGKMIRLVKVKGGWRVDANSACPNEAEMQKTLNQMRPVVEAIRKYKQAIGRPSIKAEDIDAELGREILKSLTGIETPAPHRFDINKL